VAKLKYLEMTATDINSISEELKSRLNFGDVCYSKCYQNLLSSRLLSKTVKKKKKIKNKILLVVLYGCVTWSLLLTDKHRVRVFENRMFRRISGSKRGDLIGG
jgi:hypothetical protein